MTSCKVAASPEETMMLSSSGASAAEVAVKEPCAVWISMHETLLVAADIGCAPKSINSASDSTSGDVCKSALGAG